MLVSSGIILTSFAACQNESFSSLVLNELDELKKRSENVRHVIRWLEQEFKHGNRHLRAQRDNESQPLSLLKISRKMGKH